MLAMFGNALTISNETIILLVGNPLEFMISIVCSKCSVFFILASMFLVKGAQIFSMNLDIFILLCYNQLLTVLLGFPPCVFVCFV